MKKIIFKFWIYHLLISIASFITYRIVIAETNYADRNFLETVLQILDIFLNLAYSFIYLIAIVFCSFALFLNLIAKVRNSFYLSLLTFIGIPSIYVLVIIINVVIFKDLYSGTVVKNLLFFSMVYLFIAAGLFLLFRNRIKKAALNN